MSSELPISSPYRSTPDAPVTQAERDQLNARLNTAYTRGTIADEDYRARLDRLFGATRMGELVPVVEGLPAAATYEDPEGVAVGDGRPGELAPSRNVTGISLGLIALVAVIVVLAIFFLLFIIFI